MGCVYRAYDDATERTVAIKVLRAQAMQDASVRRRFLNEARSTMRIESPHVIEITDIGELDDGSAFYAMEFLDGCTLDEHRVDTYKEVQEIALQICAGLAAAHEQLVVHRDLKPENIIVDGDGRTPRCRLIDFGIAKLPFATLMTMPGQMLGTPAYIAPEQAKAGAQVDPRCDIYALGVVLYELVSGVLPFEDEDPIMLAMAHLTRAPTPLRELAPSCPEELEALIMRCLEKDPADRHASVKALASDLESMWLEGWLDAPEPTEPHHAQTRVLERAPSPRLAVPGSVEPSHTVPMHTLRQKRLTPPGPQPWLTPIPDTGSRQGELAHQTDWLLMVVVSAALVLSIAAAAVTSAM